MAFDKLQFEDVSHLVYNREVLHNIIKTIQNMYSSNTIQAKIHDELTNPIPLYNDIRQGDSLTTLILNLIMDEIIKQVHKLTEYKMGDSEITIRCYSDCIK